MAKMNENINGWIRIHYVRAKNLFHMGLPISVMTNDRDPVTSATAEVTFKRGQEACLLVGEEFTPDTLRDVQEAFSKWLDCDGYGHQPDAYKAYHYQFSYWIREEEFEKLMKMKPFFQYKAK